MHHVMFDTAYLYLNKIEVALIEMTHCGISRLASKAR
jgi:hypothetical protein